MSSKFNRQRTRYAAPPACWPPPPQPLPPTMPLIEYLHAEGRLRWPKPAGGFEDWTRIATNIPRITATLFAKELGCGQDVLRFEIVCDFTTRRLSAQLTAYRASVFQALTSWNAVDLPAGTWWTLHLEFGDFAIPTTALAWLKVWV